MRHVAVAVVDVVVVVVVIVVVVRIIAVASSVWRLAFGVCRIESPAKSPALRSAQRRAAACACAVRMRYLMFGIQRLAEPIIVFGCLTADTSSIWGLWNFAQHQASLACSHTNPHQITVYGITPQCTAAQLHSMPLPHISLCSALVHNLETIAGS